MAKSIRTCASCKVSVDFGSRFSIYRHKKKYPNCTIPAKSRG